MTIKTPQEDRNYSISSSELHEIRERLQYVVTKTESAALRTLEESTKSLERLADMQSTLQGEENQTELPLGDIETHLREIICLQEYQDLCSQTLSRAVAILDRIESNNGLADTAEVRKNNPNDSAEEQQSFGPAFRSEGSEEQIDNQEDIDSLFDQHRAG